MEEKIKKQIAYRFGYRFRDVKLADGGPDIVIVRVNSNNSFYAIGLLSCLRTVDKLPEKYTIIVEMPTVFNTPKFIASGSSYVMEQLMQEFGGVLTGNPSCWMIYDGSLYGIRHAEKTSVSQISSQELCETITGRNTDP